MIFFSAYLHRLLGPRRASRGAPTVPPGEPGLARMVVEELAVLVSGLAGRAITVVRRKRGPGRATGGKQRP